MKQLLILSGKGGTGKTTVAGAFIELGKSRAFADCDVDAPNLHLVVSSKTEPVTTDYFGFGKAVIDSSKCVHCGLCEKNCRFGAIANGVVNLFECEGCGVCILLCPTKAITLSDYSSGSLMLYKTEDTVFSTAQLKMGSGASGKLVTAVKKQLLQEIPDAELAIIDGSPGIGCPVIASISGVDMVLIVAEPTISGIHDMKRILETAKHFGVSCAVCINKYDVNIENTEEIESYCHEIQIPVIGKIPYDETVVKAVNICKSIACYPDSPAGKAIALIWNNIYLNYKLNHHRLSADDGQLKVEKEKKVMKIAVASEGKMVTEHFGHCEGFTIFETENGQILNGELIPNPGHRPGFLPVFLYEKGVNVIISGGMGGGAVDIFNEKGIEVITGASGNAEVAVQNYLQGKLKSTGSICHEHQHADECGE